MIKAVTHDGPFYADDVMAAAILTLAADNGELVIIRSSKPRVIAEADITFDVGKVYDPAGGRFDHNQANTPRRKNGIPYASASLVWREHGREAIENILIDSGYEGDDFFENYFESIWMYMSGHVDKTVLTSIDIVDNNAGRYVLLDDSPNGRYRAVEDNNDNLFVHLDNQAFMFSDYLKMFDKPWWSAADDNNDEDFFKAVDIAVHLLETLVEDAFWFQQARHTIITGALEASKSDTPHVLVLDKFVKWKTHIVATELKDTDIKFVLIPSVSAQGVASWQVIGVPPSHQEFHSVKVPFPAAWGSLSGKDLQEQSNCKEALFCDEQLTHAIFATKTAALRVAQVLIDHERVTDRADLVSADLNIT